jgi:cyclopropane-fatty-acyl-phospholipid synthase
MDGARRIIEGLLVRADIEVGGARPWDLRIHDQAFYARVIAGGSLALGESYMDGWWDCERLDELFFRILSKGLEAGVHPSPREAGLLIKSFFVNSQARRRAFRIGERHYDLGNDLYGIMLDKGMNYSCAWWKRATSLDEAQEDKLELICRKLGIEMGMRVLDIGCGWGGFARHAAERHGAEVVGITVSKEQAELARERCAGLQVDIRLEDYRDLGGVFDRIVSIGMFEHVGPRNYRRYMEVASRCLAPDGLFLLHTIGTNRPARYTDPWVDKYIFPDSVLPSLSQIAKAAEGIFKTEDLHSFGQYYDPTLLAWERNFAAGWDRIRDRYGERFFRMWRYYLLNSAGSFRARHIQLWQLVFSPLRSTMSREIVRE